MTKRNSVKKSKSNKTESKTTKKTSQTLLEKYRSHKDDTGSTEVQIVLFSEKIADLVKHLKKHRKDSDSRRGLLSMIGKRRKLLNYLRRSEPKKYEKLIADLGLRK